MNDYKISDELRSEINQALGKASVCWHPTPKGQFLAKQAAIIGRHLAEAIEAEVRATQRLHLPTA